MIQVKYASNVKRDTVVVEDSATPRQVFEENGVDYSHGVTTLDGSVLGPGEMDKSFAELGIKERTYLYNVVKTDNA